MRLHPLLYLVILESSYKFAFQQIPFVSPKHPLLVSDAALNISLTLPVCYSAYLQVSRKGINYSRTSRATIAYISLIPFKLGALSSFSSVYLSFATFIAGMRETITCAGDPLARSRVLSVNLS